MTKGEACEAIAAALDYPPLVDEVRKGTSTDVLQEQLGDIYFREGVLNFMFTWHSTVEGHGFWSKVNEHFKCSGDAEFAERLACMPRKLLDACACQRLARV